MKWLLPACFLASACQVMDPAGYLLGVPVGVTTTNEPAIRVKLPGFGPYDPVSAALSPFDQLPVDVLAGSGVTMSPGNSPFLAMSMGLEVLAVTVASADEAVLEVGAHGWTAIAFTVDDATLGSYALSPDVLNAAGMGELDRTVFGWCLPMSEIEGLTVEEQSVRLMAPDALGLGDTDAIDAIDMHMALYHSDLQDYAHVFTGRRLTSDMWVYFTLRPQFLGGNVAGLLASHWHVAVNASTIYMTQWSGGAWTTPKVYRTWEQLGFTDNEKPAPIDGLAIDAVTPGTPSTADSILFSLAGSTQYASGPAHQILYASPSTPPSPPRRVLTRLPGGGYGSLGEQLGAGAGVGDFCTGDPIGPSRRATGSPLLDDFFVARRLGPPWPSASGFVVAPPEKLELAISGYRVRYRDSSGSTVSGVRSCMSWPRHGRDAEGRALIRWGHMTDYQSNPGGAGNIVWTGAMEIPYVGKPLTFDLELPTHGVLRRASAAAALTPADTTKAFVTQWMLQVDGVRYRSPISAMRY